METALVATVTHLRPADVYTEEKVLAAFNRHLDRCKLGESTKIAYRRQATTYLAWLARNPGRHPDAFTDQVGAEAAVDGWRKRRLLDKRSPSTVNQGVTAVLLMYQIGTHLRLKVDRARVAKPGAPDALTGNEAAALQRAADRRGPRDAAVIGLMLNTGARVEEVARLDVEDVPTTARTGMVRLLGKGHEVRLVPLPPSARERLTTWLAARAEVVDAELADVGRLWIGQRGALTIEGITKVVLAAGKAAGIASLRPHALRHTYATRLREGGADPAQIQKLMGHASIETTQRYFRASDEEVADLVAKVFG